MNETVYGEKMEMGEPYLKGGRIELYAWDSTCAREVTEL